MGIRPLPRARPHLKSGGGCDVVCHAERGGTESHDGLMHQVQSPSEGKLDERPQDDTYFDFPVNCQWCVLDCTNVALLRS